jgi:phosphoribosylanthranilate isomerase
MQAPTRIKLCGMTRAEDVQQAVALDVDFIGLIFAARSPRRLGLAQAASLRELVPASTQVVALVMDNGADEIEAILAQVRPDLLQFHGAEPAGFCDGFGLPYFKAIAMGDGLDPRPQFDAYPAASGFVLDGHGAGEPGGSGKRFDWSRLPQAEARPLLLAGGLGPNNVARAIAIARPWGVDVSSGIEDAPGVKNAETMRRFVAAVRAADGPPSAAAIG